jgi:hypothetical protein
MTPGQLVKAVSIALDVPEETVVQHDRNLVVAGLRTTGARGINAPPVTHLDAARLVAAVLGSVRVKDSALVVQRLEQNKFDSPKSFSERVAGLRAAGAMAEFEADTSDREKFSDPAIMTLPPTHNFVDAIASLIGDASAPISNLDNYLKRFAPLFISCEAPWSEANIVHMDFMGSSASYRKEPATGGRAASLLKERPRHERYAGYYGIIQKREVYGSAIMLLGRAFREDGLNFASTREALNDFLGEKPEKRRAPKKALA